MKIIERLTNSAKKVAVSRTAQIFFFVHLIVLIVALTQKVLIHQTIQPIHLENELYLYKTLTIINLPGALVSAITTFPIIYIFCYFLCELPPVSLNGQYPFIIISYIGWQIQWALIGYGIEKTFFFWRGLK